MSVATVADRTTGTSTPAAGRVLARPSTSLAPRIVILGGGFAGVTAALELASMHGRPPSARDADQQPELLPVPADARRGRDGRRRNPPHPVPDPPAARRVGRRVRRDARRGPLSLR